MGAVVDPADEKPISNQKCFTEAQSIAFIGRMRMLYTRLKAEWKQIESRLYTESIVQCMHINHKIWTPHWFDWKLVTFIATTI